MEKDLKKNVYIYSMQPNIFAEYQKLAQHCKPPLRQQQQKTENISIPQEPPFGSFQVNPHSPPNTAAISLAIGCFLLFLDST